MRHQLERAVRRHHHHVVLVLSRPDAPLLGATHPQMRRDPWLGFPESSLVDRVDDAEGGCTRGGRLVEVRHLAERRIRIAARG
eukprot:scaffold13134_cov69-Phaeocystis_antarctica.AAC.13